MKNTLPNDYVTKDYFNEVISQKFNAVMDKLDKVIGEYRNHSDEHVLINGKLSDHSDRLEVVEEKLGIVV